MASNALSRSEHTPSLFSDFFRPWSDWFNNSDFPGRIATLPAVNVSETPDKYQVSLAAPGLRKEDFQINVDDNMITVSAEKEESSDNGGERFTRREYSYSSFARSFSLPGDVEAEKIEAQYQDGVLKITLPKKNLAAKSAAAKKINVK
jgi:HSP20 family protein